MIDLNTVNRAKLAKAVNLTPSGISRILCGNRNSKMRTISAIAKALELSVDDLMAAIELARRERQN